MHNPLTKTTTLYLSQPPGRHQRGRWATLIREVQEGIVRSTRGDRSESESPTDPAQPKPARNAATTETQKHQPQLRNEHEKKPIRCSSRMGLSIAPTAARSRAAGQRNVTLTRASCRRIV